MIETGQFFTLLREYLEKNSFIRLILGKYRGNEIDLRNIEIKSVSIKSQDSLSFVYQYKTKDITKNFPVGEGIEAIRGLLGADFKSAHLFSLTEDVQIEFSKRGKCMLSRSKATCGNTSDKNTTAKSTGR